LASGFSIPPAPDSGSVARAQALSRPAPMGRRFAGMHLDRVCFGRAQISPPSGAGGERSKLRLLQPLPSLCSGSIPLGFRI
jgi:hypothetical protein